MSTKVGPKSDKLHLNIFFMHKNMLSNIWKRSLYAFTHCLAIFSLQQLFACNKVKGHQNNKNTPHTFSCKGKKRMLVLILDCSKFYASVPSLLFYFSQKIHSKFYLCQFCRIYVCTYMCNHTCMYICIIIQLTTASSSRYD